MVEQIPREKIENGITLCLNRVTEYLLDAEGLSNQSASQGTLQNAAILVTFAIEELGQVDDSAKALRRTVGPEECTGGA